MQVKNIIEPIPNASAIRIPMYLSSNNSMNGVKTTVLIVIMT